MSEQDETNNCNNVIAVTFGVDDIVVPSKREEEPVALTIVEDAKETSVDEDVDFAKKTLRKITEQASRVAEAAADNAVASGLPEQVETYAILLKSIVDAQKALADTAERASKRRAQDKQGNYGKSDNPVNQNLFVGSTKELAEFLEKRSKDEQGKT